MVGSTCIRLHSRKGNASTVSFELKQSSLTHREFGP